MSPLIPITIASLTVAVVASLVAYRYWSSHRLHQRCVRLCHRIAHELSQPQEAQLVTERVFDTVMEHTEASIGVLGFHSQESGRLEVIRVRGLPGHLIAPGELLPSGAKGWEIGSVQVSGRLEIIRDGLKAAMADVAGIQLDRHQNMICVPVSGSGSAHGLLQLVSGPGTGFDAENIKELEGVGYYLNAAINNAVVIETLQRERDASAALYDIGLTISRFLDLDEILEHAVSKVQEILDSQVTWYLDCTQHEAPLAVIRAVAGIPPEPYQTGRVVHLRGQVGHFLRSKEGSEPVDHILIQDLGVPHDGDPLFCDAEFDRALVASGAASVVAVPVGDDDSLMGVLCSFSKQAHQYGNDEVDLLHRVATQLLIALKTCDLHATRKAVAVMEERQRLSDELHDNMAQVITGVSLELHYLEKLAGKNMPDKKFRALVDRLQAIRQTLADAKAAIRHAIFELRLPEDKDLWSNLLDFSRRFERWHDLQVEVALPSEPLQLPIKDQREVIHIAQEALWNVRKHSGMNKAKIKGNYEPHSGDVSLVISDKGAGSFDQMPDMGQGITTMRDRALRLGGSLNVEKQRDSGVNVVLRFNNG